MADRLLVIDASLARRLASELRMRGRAASTVADLASQDMLDPPLLRRLTEVLAGEDWTLVTADDAMPAEHADEIAELGLTIATVRTQWQPSGIDQENAKREVVHRWAHVMAKQPAGSIRRYSATRWSVWRPTRKA